MKIGRYEVMIVAVKNDGTSESFRKDSIQFLRDLRLALSDTVMYNEENNWIESLKRHEEWLEDVSDFLTKIQ